MSLTRPIGHDDVIERLVQLLERDRLPHALLFAGPAGIGKCLAAHWLAAWVFCQSEATRPCGGCTGCLQAEARSHPDLFLVERLPGKKEVGIDLIRSLKHFVQLRAVSGHRKVAIIAEAERLSTAAQNGLLKTLEEPPGHALIMLVTPTSEILLRTVRSRCQQVRFRPLGNEQVSAVLEHHCGIEAEEAGLLALSAEGSPGHALQLRKLLAGTRLDDLLQAVAALDPTRYGSVARAANELGKSEEAITIRLQLLLSAYHEAAVGPFAGNRANSTFADRMGEMATDAAVRRFEAVSSALRTLQRRNPNRPLLAEALALRLARS